MRRLVEILRQRFGEEVELPANVPDIEAASATLLAMAERRSHRKFDDKPVDPALIRLLCAVALSAPSKSDLQQRDIVIVTEPKQLDQLKACVTDQAWTADIATLLVLCGNNRRQRQIHALRDRPFANDHFDAAFNAAVDAGIALQAFITAAEAVGLGCCPLSAIRNQPETVSRILGLPDHVFPVAGLAVGWPTESGTISPRLPLTATVHEQRFSDLGIEEAIAAYDARRIGVQPYAKQRGVDRFGTLPATSYGWSEDKARQYAEPERAGFAAFLSRIGFRLT